MKQHRENHIEIIDFLRGLAALSVVLFHFATSSIASIKPNLVSDFFAWGKLGVQVFFVISGFIIPYSMFLGSYKLRDFGVFMLRRFLRINPPSYVAILMVIGLYYSAIWLVDRPISGMYWPGTDWKTILANLTYFFDFLDSGKYIVVYWTLEVEFQYYIFIGLFYPIMILLSKKTFWLVVAFIGYACLTYVPFLEEFPFFRMSSYFIMGNLLFLYKQNKIRRELFVPLIIAAMLFCNFQQGSPYVFAAVIALLVIAFVRFNNPVSSFLGKISYSLYITFLFSAFVMEIALNRVLGSSFEEPLKTVMMIPYTLWAIFFAWVFYTLVEKPFLKLSKYLTTTKK